MDRTERIQKALEGAGLKWLFTGNNAPDNARGLAEEFDEAENFYNRRYKANLGLLDKVEANPELYKPFLQSIGLPMSRQMRTVILRLLEGKEIRELKFHYRKNGDSTLLVRLNEDWPGSPIKAPFAMDALVLPQLAYHVSADRVELGRIRPWDLPGDDES